MEEKTTYKAHFFFIFGFSSKIPIYPHINFKTTSKKNIEGMKINRLKHVPAHNKN